MLNESPGWVEEVRREIKRLDNKLRRLEQLQKSDDLTSEQCDDYMNWKGWRDALRWALQMRDGKSSRKSAWGRSDVG